MSLASESPKMIPVGYIYKSVAAAPSERGLAKNIVDVYSAGECGGCVTESFVPHFQRMEKVNGWFFYNSPEEMEAIALENEIDLSNMTLFFYETYKYEYDEKGETEPIKSWSEFERDCHNRTEVLLPRRKQFIGYDVVEYVCRNLPECSLLGCTKLTMKYAVNSHCLFDTFDQAKVALESGDFHAHEPGPYRIMAVYVVDRVNGYR